MSNNITSQKIYGLALKTTGTTNTSAEVNLDEKSKYNMLGVRIFQYSFPDTSDCSWMNVTYEVLLKNIKLPAYFFDCDAFQFKLCLCYEGSKNCYNMDTGGNGNSKHCKKRGIESDEIESDEIESDVKDVKSYMYMYSLDYKWRYANKKCRFTKCRKVEKERSGTNYTGRVYKIINDSLVDLDKKTIKNYGKITISVSNKPLHFPYNSFYNVMNSAYRIYGDNIQPYKQNIVFGLVLSTPWCKNVLIKVFHTGHYIIVPYTSSD